MVNSADDVRQAASEIVELAGAPFEMILCIETPAAIGGLRELVAASDHVRGLLGGGFDYTMAIAPLQLIHHKALAAPPPPELDPLIYSRQVLLCTARAAGIHVYDGLQILDHKDEVEVARAARLVRVLGFDGCMCFAPSLLPAIREAFAPTAEEIAWAQTIIGALRDARAQGRSAAYTVYGTALPHHLEIASEILARIADGAASECEDDLAADGAGEHRLKAGSSLGQRHH
jgi:citrate lyase subunit beta/citryl-CoA lyase